MALKSTISHTEAGCEQIDTESQRARCLGWTRGPSVQRHPIGGLERLATEQTTLTGANIVEERWWVNQRLLSHRIRYTPFTSALGSHS